MGSASLLAAGNIASRLLGLVREQVIANYWGGSLEASAFSAAARVPTMLYDLLVGGMLSAALVPVLTEYATTKRDELWRTASVLLSACSLLMGTLAVVVYLLSTPIASLLAAGLGDEGVAMVATCLRFISPAVFAFGIAGVLTGLLYSIERFSLPAASGALYNAAFIVVAVLLRDRLGIYSLPLGVALGGLAQTLLLAPGLRDASLRPRLDLHHPALRRVVLLYVPIGAGLVVAQIQVLADTRLASEAGKSALVWMRYATTLVQFPHGLVAVAISLAILPRLAASHAELQDRAYARILARAVRMVVTLSVPAAVGLVVLAEPLVGALFQRGEFLSGDRVAVVLALYGYSIGLVFASVDWPLNYAFYARQNTVVPALVGVASVGVYLVVALAMGPTANALGLAANRVFIGLVLADSAKHAFHAGLMLVLVRRAAGGEALSAVGRTVLAAAAAAGAMGVVVHFTRGVLAAHWAAGTMSWLAQLGIGAAVGVVVYIPLVRAFGCREIDWLAGVIRERFLER